MPAARKRTSSFPTAEPDVGDPSVKRTRLDQASAEYQEDQEDEQVEYEVQNGNASDVDLDDVALTTAGPSNSHADAGPIEHIEVFNFMCHKRMRVDLCPNLNFIVGHNGSGKSAVLTAITIALGGKASTTNRAGSLKSFIKSGENSAEIVVRIRNRGEDAYQHNVYGDSITIIRRIHLDGSGSWKLQGHDGKTKSSQKSELSRICDHLDIQVDNPMSVLNQDAARQFLSASNPEDKYALFLKGTQLTQLANEMDTLKEHNIQIKTTLARQKDYLPDVKADYEEKLRKFAQFEKQRQGKQKLEELTDLYIWAQVAEAKRKYDKTSLAVERQEAKITKAQQAAQDCAVEVEQVNATLSLIEQERDRDRDTDEHLAVARDQARAHVRQVEAEQTELNERLSETNQLYQTYKTQLETAEYKLNQELSRAGQAGERDAWIKRRTTAQAQVTEVEQELADLQLRKDELEQQLGPIQEAIQNHDSDLTRVSRNIAGAERTIREIKAASQDNLSAFGRYMPQLVNAIRQEKGWHRMPVGPIGSLMKLKDNFWINIIEAVLDKELNGFCVVDEHDRLMLLRMTRHFNCAQFVPVIRGSDEAFDYSRGESDPSMTTILRVCEFDSEYAKGQLIIARGIESMVLVKQRSDGDQLLRSAPEVRLVHSADLYRIQGGSRTSSSTTMQRPNGPHRLSKDNSGALAETNAALAEMHQERTNIHQAREAKRTELQTVKTQMRSISDRISRLHRTLRQAQNEVSSLTTRIQAQTTVDVDAFQVMVDQAKQHMEDMKNQFVLHDLEVKDVATKLDQAVAAYDEAQSRLADRDSGQQEIADAATREAQKRIALNHKINHLQRQLETYANDLGNFAEQQSNEQSDYDELVQQAQEHTHLEYKEVPDKTTPDKIEREIRAWEQYMEKMRHKTGGNIDAAKMEIEEVQARLETLRERIAKLQNFASQLDRSFHDRWIRWHFWRSVIALRAKSLFTANLEHRGFSGSLSFDHEEVTPEGRRNPGKLQIKVQTEHGPGADTKSNLQKETKALSGGEKSFSTICLLLSLWEAINCPIRCLDEFDVFMDSANRAISTKMIVDACKVNRRVQYVLISPQSMTSTELGDDTRVIMMKDPERNH